MKRETEEGENAVAMLVLRWFQSEMNFLGSSTKPGRPRSELLHTGTSVKQNYD